jgi:hypothetical protein
MPANEANRPPRPTLTPRQQYVSYLSTSALVAVIEEVERKLVDNQLTASSLMRSIYRGIHEDAVNELAGRQLRLWDPPRQAED